MPVDRLKLNKVEESGREYLFHYKIVSSPIINHYVQSSEDDIPDSTEEHSAQY